MKTVKQLKTKGFLTIFTNFIPGNKTKNYVKSKFIFFFYLASFFILGSYFLQGCETDIEEAIGVNEIDLKANSKAAVNKTKEIALELIAENMVSPVGLVPVPDTSGRLFVIDQVGIIWIIDASGNRLEEPFLDVRDRMITLNSGYDERGLLGLAFHPDFAMNGRVFAYYTAPPNAGGPGEGGWDNISRISEFSVSPSTSNTADLSSEKVILEIDQPQRNHEGGTIAFGPDGYLYISIGDGGGAHDIGPGHVEDWYEINEGGNGQDIEANLLGNILRIDINAGDTYVIPADNPFVGIEGKDEIYAYGFRNPFRFSFDISGSRRLFVGDAGQHLWEEISVVEKGGNYGWNVKEGTHCFSTDNPGQQILENCPDVDIYGNQLIDPVIEMRNSGNPMGGETVTIIGGYVYRGNSIPGLQGKYVFGSFSHNFRPTGEIFVSNPAGPGLWPFQEIMLENNAEDIGNYLKGFGQDLEGEIYVAASEVLGPTGDSGKIFKLVWAKKKDESL